MKCHKCNQDSIKIHYSPIGTGDSSTHIKCDICGLYIKCGDNSELLCTLFIFNENLKEADELGREAYGAFLDERDNPYSTSSDQIAMHKSWISGYTVEKRDCEYVALTLSAKKTKEEYEKRITTLERTVESQFKHIQKVENREIQLQKKVDNFLSVNKYHIRNFCDKLLGRSILGRFLKKQISSFQAEYTIFLQMLWGDES